MPCAGHVVRELPKNVISLFVRKPFAISFTQTTTPLMGGLAHCSNRFPIAAMFAKQDTNGVDRYDLRQITVEPTDCRLRSFVDDFFSELGHLSSQETVRPLIEV